MAKKRTKKGRPAKEWKAKSPTMMVKYIPYRDGQETELNLLHWSPLKAIEMGQCDQNQWEVVKARLIAGIAFCDYIDERSAVLREIESAQKCIDSAYSIWKDRNEIVLPNLESVKNAFFVIDDIEKILDRHEVYCAYTKAVKLVLNES